MTQDAVMILRYLIRTIWTIFTSVTIPGTNVTFAGWAYFCLLVSFIARVIQVYFRGGDK